MRSHPEGRAPIFSILRNADFRSLWYVGVLAEGDRWMELFVLSWLILQVTDSAFQVGLVLVFNHLPWPFFSLFTGFIADRLNRQRMLVVSATINIVVATILLTLIIFDLIQPWHVFLLTFITGVAKSLEEPCRRTAILDIVGERRLVNGMALEVINNTTGKMAGPLLAGILIDTVDFTGAYAAVLAVHISIMALVTLRVRIPLLRRYTQTEPVWRGLKMAVNYALHSRMLLGLLYVTFVMNAIAFPVRQFIPVIGRDHLHVGATLVGLLVSSEGFGQMIGAGFMALTRDLQYLGRVYVFGSIAVLVMAMLFAWSPWYALAFGLLTVGGIGQAGFSAMQAAITMLTAPPEMRGRMLGLVGVCIGVGGPLGTLEMGAIAVISAQWAISGNAMVGLVLLLPVFLVTPLVSQPVTQPSATVSATGDSVGLDS